MNKRITTRDIVLTALLAAILVASKQILSFLPNVELITLLVILYSLHYPRLAPFAIYIFVGIQCCIYGLNLWVYMYLYIWILLYFVVRILHRVGTHLLWVIVCAMFGLLFGLLCSPVYLFIGGWGMAVSWFLSGIAFDLIHAVSNALLAAVLFVPLDKHFSRLENQC